MVPEFIRHLFSGDPNFRVFYFAGMTAVALLVGFLCLELLDCGLGLTRPRKRRR